MKQSALYLFACVTILLTTTALIVGQSGNPWKLRKQENGISIYARSVENSDLEEIMAELVVKTSMKSLVLLLSDVPGYKDWVYSCLDAYLLEEKGDTVDIYYMLSDVPWPVEDRDVVLYTSYEQDSKSLVVTSKTYDLPGWVDQPADIVRVPELAILWLLTPLDKENIRIQYFIRANPGGNIPDWVMNMFVTIGPYESLLLLPEMLKKEKYQNPKLNFIIEK